MKLNTKVSEGKKRLRLLVSSLIATATYIYFFVNEWSVDTGEALLAFPLLSALGFGLAFILFSAIYWVLDGFSKHGQEAKSQTPTTDAKILFRVSEPFSIAFQKLLVDFSGMYQSQDVVSVKVRDQISESWKKTALLYAYGVVSVCMYSKDVNYMKSNVARDFADKIADEYSRLSIEEDKKYFPKYADTNASVELARGEVIKISELVLQICREFSKNESLGDPFKPLNEYVVEITGMNDTNTLEKLGKTAKMFTTMINKKLAF